VEVIADGTPSITLSVAERPRTPQRSNSTNMPSPRLVFHIKPVFKVMVHPKMKKLIIKQNRFPLTFYCIIFFLSKRNQNCSVTIILQNSFFSKKKEIQIGLE